MSTYFAVNTIAFRYDGTMFTGGSDGNLNFWDIYAFNRTFTITNPYPPYAITAGAFSPDGSHLAYAYGYDWSTVCAAHNDTQGHEGSTQYTRDTFLVMKEIDQIVCRPA